MINGMKIDLHMHSNVSDGTDTPPELLEKVRQSGIRLFALGDTELSQADGLPEGLRRFLEETGQADLIKKE